MFFSCKSWEFNLIHIVLVVGLLASTAHGFFPTDWKEKFFGKGGISHEAQTRKAYETLATKYFPDITPLKKTMLKARDDIAQANADVDDDQTTSAKHFDGESFPAGAQRLLDLRKEVIDYVGGGLGDSARKSLGGALHTLQDFYAHTNWVELGNSDINYELGKSASLAHASFKDRTCNKCTEFPFPDDSICHDCRLNTNNFTLLTSGYYFGEDSPGPGIEIPDYKCHHGGVTDNSFGAVFGVFLGDVTPGINKDSNNCFWSPHSDLHPEAARLSIKATTQFIDDIMAELDQKGRKTLFGVGGTLAFSIDTTGSMADVIASVREQSIAIVNSRLGTPDEPAVFVVAPFNDPTTGPDTNTTDFNVFQSAISSLSADGGGDCPELSLTGMLDAMSLMDGPADLFVMTDAAAKDFDLESQVIDTAVQKSININIFKFDSDCDDGALEKRQDSQANLVYGSIASASGGSYHSLPRNEVNNISGLLDTFTKSDSTGILKIADTASPGTPSTYSVPVDSQLTSLSISFRGSDLTLSITRPDGSTLDLSSAGVTSTVFTDGQFITIKSPVSGTWTISVTGGGDFSFDVTGITSLYLSSFNFVAISGRPGHEGYFPISGSPAYDHKVAAVGMIDGPFTSAKFDLRTPNGTLVVDAGMLPGSGEDGDPPSNSFYGVMNLVPGTLYVYCSGLDGAGVPFQRVLSSVFTPIQSNTNDTGINDTNPFAALNSTTSTTTTTTTTSTTTSARSSTGPYSNTTTTTTSYSTYETTDTTSGAPYTKPSETYDWTPPPYSTPKWTNPHTCEPGVVYTHSQYGSASPYGTSNANYAPYPTTEPGTGPGSTGYVTISSPSYPTEPGSKPETSLSSAVYVTASSYPTEAGPGPESSTEYLEYAVTTTVSTYDIVYETPSPAQSTEVVESAYYGSFSFSSSSADEYDEYVTSVSAGGAKGTGAAAATSYAGGAAVTESKTTTANAAATTTTSLARYTGGATHLNPLTAVAAMWTCMMLACGLLVI